LRPILSKRVMILTMVGTILVGRRTKNWKWSMRGRTRSWWEERVVVTHIIFFFIAKTMLFLILSTAPVPPCWDQSWYLFLNHFSNLQWFQVTNLQFFNHLHCHINGSVVYGIEWKEYVSLLPCMQNKTLKQTTLCNKILLIVVVSCVEILCAYHFC